MDNPSRKSRILSVQEADFSVRTLIDRRNERLKVLAYRGEEIAPLGRYLVETAREQGLGKVVVPAREADWQSFLSRGFTLEGRLERFYSGSPAHYMAYFLRSDRHGIPRLNEEQEILQGVLDADASATRPLTEPYRMIEADETNAEELASIYDRVFESYPSPLTDPDYIRELIHSGEGLFLAIYENDRLASAAAAEIDLVNSNAELTNCATHPDYRGEGLMANLIEALINRMTERRILCLYSMARSLSPGMNLILKRAGFSFRGRLTNHAHIGGGFENLNLWEL